MEVSHQGLSSVHTDPGKQTTFESPKWGPLQCFWWPFKYPLKHSKSLNHCVGWFLLLQFQKELFTLFSLQLFWCCHLFFNNCTCLQCQDGGFRGRQWPGSPHQRLPGHVRCQLQLWRHPWWRQVRCTSCNYSQNSISYYCPHHHLGFRTPALCSRSARSEHWPPVRVRAVMPLCAPCKTETVL